MPDVEPRKAYVVLEAVKGIMTYVVYADTAKEAKEIYWREGECVDVSYHPAGVNSVRRAPGEDQ